jgi:hypothetical protein
MNLTLSIDSELLKKARKAAVEMDTTVNSLVRKYLRDIVAKKNIEESVFIDEWRRLMDEHPVQMREQTWTRDNLHER